MLSFQELKRIEFRDSEPDGKLKSQKPDKSWQRFFLFLPYSTGFLIGHEPLKGTPALKASRKKEEKEIDESIQDNE